MTKPRDRAAAAPAANNTDDSGLGDMDITRQELDSIGEALKNEQFRKLLCEYVDEINDPENRARYERELEQYERERGAHVTFVRLRPGYALKTSADGVRKVFVNVCSSEALQRPAARPADGGDRWSLPHCMSPARRDYDKAGKPCDVYDVVFHPDALDLVRRGRTLKDMVEDTALSAVEKNAGVALDRANVKYPKIRFKGVQRSLMIRKPIEGFAQRVGEEERQRDEEEPPLPGCPYKPAVDTPVRHYDLGPLKQKSLYAVPKYVIKHRSDVDIQEHGYNMHCKMNATVPKELIVEIRLPLLDSSANVELDVLPKSLKLVCHKPSKYKLDVGLPYAVLEDEGSATFDRSTKTLIVRLVVRRTEPALEYSKHLVAEVEATSNDDDDKCEKNGPCDITVVDDQPGKTVTDNEELVVKNGHTDGQESGSTSDSGNASTDDVHYILPEHEFIFGNKCVLTFNVKNVDPTSVNVIVINDKNLISGKFHSIGSGFFPIWFAFCIQIPSKTSLLKSDIKITPSDNNLVLEFSSLNFKSERQQYFYGLDQHNLTVHQCAVEETLKENSKALANGVTVAFNDSDDDDDDDDNDEGDDDDEVFDNNSKDEILSKGQQQQNIKKSDDSSRHKDKNGKTIKEKGKKKKRNKIQKSNAIPIASSNNTLEVNKKIDFVPGSLPIEFNGIRPTIRGILKKRALSECSNVDDVILSSPQKYSSSVDNVDTENSDVLESSYNDSISKKTVRFNDHVIEKKINFSLSIAAQAKKHRQRQQRKRNIREYSTPSESEASEAEDRTYGPLNVVSESEETTSVSESSAGEMSDDSSNGPIKLSSKVTVVNDSKKDHKRRKSKSARKNASLAKQASTNNLIFPIEY